MSTLFSPNEYINKSWSDTSEQYNVCNYIKANIQDYDSSKTFATFKGYKLMAMAPYFSDNDSGKIVRVTYLIDASSNNAATESFEAIIVDSKGDETLNYSQPKGYPNVGSYDVKTGKHAGHFMFQSYLICITEMVSSSGKASDFAYQFNNNYSSDSRVISVRDTGKTIYTIK